MFIDDFSHAGRCEVIVDFKYQLGQEYLVFREDTVVSQFLELKTCHRLHRCHSTMRNYTR